MNAPKKSEIRNKIESHRQDIIDWTMELIRFPSENRPPQGNEKDAQTWYAGQCEKIGLEVERYSPTSVPGIEKHEHWLDGREYQNKRDNIAATWTGKSGKEKSVLFSGHMDVAPYEPDYWSVCRPFEPVVKGDRLYGRGSADMKGGLAAAYWAIAVLKELSFKPEGTVYCEAVVDEEFAGGNGTLAGRLRGYNTDLAVYMEPSAMKLCPSGLGAFLGDIYISGDSGMPYTGRALANPIFGMSRIITHFESWLKTWRQKNSHHHYSDKTENLNLVLWNLDSNVSGGSSQMGIPQAARMSFIVFCYPGTEAEDIENELNDFFEQKRKTDSELKPFSITIEPAYHFIAPWETPAGEQVIYEIQQAYKQYTGVEAMLSGAPFSSDMAVYGKYGGMPTVILGPRGDNLHGPNEWVLIDDVLDLTGVFASLITSHCS
ncbi:MAG: M20/M25/M40 family metallo-hydrolase [Spirochaetales bacterium]|nr:M20/M25/M40 family metallo-hydrolase [Spirochaetales bacterium]MCF7938419.1 M20/M25/M40 family metallo-hydrolase [Spirochaetales bacterium]